MSHPQCQACNGYGYILAVRLIDGRRQTVKQQCAACNGTGRCGWR